MMTHSRHSLATILALSVCLATIVLAPAQAPASAPVDFRLTQVLNLSGLGPVIDMTSSDLNGNGHYELIIATGSRVIVYQGDGTGSFTWASTKSAPAPITCMTWGQFDADSDYDVAVGCENGYVYVFHGNGSTGFDISYDSWSVGGAPSAIDSFDIDGDTDKDWVVALPTLHSVKDLYNDGTGSPTSEYERYLASWAEPVDVLGRDFNGDNYTDMVILCQGSTPTLFKYVTAGTPALASDSFMTLTGTPESFFYGQANGDSHTDLMISDSASNDVQCLFNDGTGTFFSVTVPVGGPTAGIFVYPFDSADCVADLVVVDTEHDTLVRMLNDGTGSFSLSSSSSHAPDVDALAVVLLDGDGRYDLAVGGGDRVYLYRNTSAPDRVRLSGANRYQTAITVSERSHSGGATNVVLTTGENFPDALAGAPLASMLDAPILLTPSDYLASDVATEIIRLDPTNVYILGGTGAVSSAVFDAVDCLAPNVYRLGGIDRYETAMLIAQEMEDYSMDDIDTAFFATGENFPDALAASPYAAAMGQPILLVRQSSIPSATATAISGLALAHSRVLGGESVVGPSVFDALPDADRLSGSNRYETSKEIAEDFLANGAVSYYLMVATGENFPDALAAGPFAARGPIPLVLVKDDDVPAATAAFLADEGPSCSSRTDIDITIPTDRLHTSFTSWRDTHLVNRFTNRCGNPPQRVDRRRS